MFVVCVDGVGCVVVGVGCVCGIVMCEGVFLCEKGGFFGMRLRFFEL